MTLPANVRVNANFPFPALVKGSGPVTVAKVNGIWTLGFDIIDLGLQTPQIANYANEFVIIYDNIARQFYRVALSSMTLLTRTQRSVTSSPISILSTDMILNVNINSGSPACALPPAAGQLGVPLTFKDVGAHLAAHPLTITPNGAETIDGAGTLVMSINRAAVTLNPFNDGVNTGWFIT